MDCSVGAGRLVAAVRLRQDAVVRSVAGGRTAIAVGAISIDLPALSPASHAALVALAAGDVPELDALADVTAVGGLRAALGWQALLTRLDAAGLLERAVLAASGPIARLRPTVIGRTPGTAARAPGWVRLSRFAVIHAVAGKFVAERPGGHALAEFAPAAAGALAAAAGGTSLDGGSGPDGGFREIANLLAGAGLLAPGGPDADPEVAEFEFAQWPLPDLWLHAASRTTRGRSGYGGTYPMAGRFPPLPALPEPRSGKRIDLARPDLESIARHDPPLTTVLEERGSVRVHDPARPVSVDQLGELLYRSARVRRVFDGGDGQQLAGRPYPCGGSVHELELYPLITNCAGAPAGLWHYAAAGHALEHVADPGPATQALVNAARSASTMQTDPQVLLIVAARFGRIMWKYDTIGYSLVLKHVGVLFQTIYLVATAMGLAVCGIGGGDAGDFAAASGLPFHAEGSVGELIIGSRPDTA